jgi:hypothetical protein
MSGKIFFSSGITFFWKCLDVTYIYLKVSNVFRPAFRAAFHAIPFEYKINVSDESQLGLCV